jgi:hypothetical protein
MYNYQNVEDGVNGDDTVIYDINVVWVVNVDDTVIYDVE